MAKQLRITDKTHADLAFLAREHTRTITGQLEIIVDNAKEAYYAADIKQYEARAEVVMNLPEEAYPKELFSQEYDLPKKIGMSEVPNPGNGEKPCCKNEFKPCAHWNWDANSGEGYVNSLSGRTRDAE